MLKSVALAAVAAVLLASPAAAQSLSVDGELSGDLQITSVTGESNINALSYSGVETAAGGGYAIAGNLQATGVSADQTTWSSYNDVGNSMDADGYNLNVSGVVSGGTGLGKAEGLSGFDATMSNEGLAAALDIEIDAEIGF